MKTLLNVLLVGFLITVSGLAAAAPKSDVIRFWTAHNPDSQLIVSHRLWQEVLDEYLDAEHASGVNRFDYAAVTKADAKKLDSYLETLQSIDPRTLNRNEQLPYWINFYNALTVNVILNKFPVDSIRDIRFFTSPLGPWDKNLVKVVDKDLSLNDIEHRILRPIWQDPRIHFSVNCASIGCPNLAPIAFTSKNTEALMERSAIDFINHQRGVKITGAELVLSSIFEWYGDDFGEDESEILSYLSEYYKGDNSSRLLENNAKVKYQYDWRLNKPY